jgi:uroporphyrinogen decarboxylase
MSANKTWDPLPREEVIKAVERRGPERPPLVMAKWWGEGLHEQYGDRLDEFDKYPHDVEHIMLSPLDVGQMNLSWKTVGGQADSSNFVIDDWAHLDEFIEKMQASDLGSGYDAAAESAEAARKDDRYVLFGWWGLFFERPWGLRGMENLMVDYYTDPEMVHRLHDALADQYIRHIRHAVEVVKPDGFWTSDDLGHQTQSMMRAETFDALHKPYYSRIGAELREHGVHFWLHSCGNNTPLMPMLIEAGVDMFHPVQKHTMDEPSTAELYGDQISFLAGIDVQHTLQEMDPEGVRAEVRFLIDTFDRPDGGMAIAAGNGIVSGTPFENIDAFLDEALTYGAAHRKTFR